MKSIDDKLNKIIDNVKKLMTYDQRCRNDDWYLVIKYHSEIDQVAMETETEVIYFKNKIEEHTMTPFSTISRARRAIQETREDGSPGDLLPTDPMILIKRRFHAKQIKLFFSNQPKLIEEYQELAYFK